MKLEQLHYLIAGFLAPNGFKVTGKGVQLALEGLCISPFITAARPDNLRAWTFYRMPKDAIFSPQGSSEGRPDPKEPDPYLVSHRPFLMVPKLWNWKEGK